MQQRRNKYDEWVADFWRSKTLRYALLFFGLLVCFVMFTFACLGVVGVGTILGDLGR